MSSKLVKHPRRLSIFLSDETDRDARVIAAETRKSISHTVDSLIKLGVRAFRAAQKGESTVKTALVILTLTTTLFVAGCAAGTSRGSSSDSFLAAALLMQNQANQMARPTSGVTSCIPNGLGGFSCQQL